MAFELLSIAGLTFLIMISPGPDLALVTRNTLAGGQHAGAWTSAGILTGNLIHLGYCLLGVGWLIANSIVAFTLLKLVGGAYLIYLGVQSFRGSTATSSHDENLAVRGKRWWIQGLLNNLLNPKGPLFSLGLIAVFVDAGSGYGFMALLVLTTIGVSAGFWLVFVFLLQVSVVRHRLMALSQWVNRVLGLILGLLGIRLWLSEAPEL